MSTASLSSSRKALSRLLSLTDEEGSPIGPTAQADLNGEFSAVPMTAGQTDIERMIDELRIAVGLHQVPDGSVSFFERLCADEEEYHLRYKLGPPRSSVREERVIGQIDIGKILTLTRHLPAKEGESGKSENRNLDGQSPSVRVQIQQTQELDSGATVKTDTTWTDGQLGPVEQGALVEFLQPAIDLLKREK